MEGKVRIAVLVSGGGTNLQALIDAERTGLLRSGELVLVLSDRKDAFALERARAAGKDAFAVDRKAFSEARAFEAELLRLLRQYETELIVLAGFLYVLSKDFVSLYGHRIINIHPSLIPSFCGKGFYGLRVHEKALEYGVKVTGATVHFVNEITDGGEIIKQKAVEVSEGDTPQSLQKRVMTQAEQIILPQACEEVCRKILKGREKNECLSD